MHIAATHITLYVSCRTDVRGATVDRAQDERGHSIGAIRLSLAANRW
jgi:hypothetical protein